MTDNDSKFYQDKLVVGNNGALGPVHVTIPEGDNRERLVCRECDFIWYKNPVVVVGAVATWNDGDINSEDYILLCRRAIEPQTGLWTLPAGYLELEESSEEGAIRETWEEAQARISINRLLAIYNIPRLSQIQLIYKASMLSKDIAPGEESLEVQLFRWNDIPWDEIAFPTVRWALNQYQSIVGTTEYPPFTNPVN